MSIDLPSPTAFESSDAIAKGRMSKPRNWRARPRLCCVMTSLMFEHEVKATGGDEPRDAIRPDGPSDRAQLLAGHALGDQLDLAYIGHLARTDLHGHPASQALGGVADRLLPDDEVLSARR